MSEPITSAGVPVHQLFGQAFSDQLAQALRNHGYPGTAATVARSLIVRRCGCDTDGCATVYLTADRRRAISLLLPELGHVVIDVDPRDDELLGIEILDRPDLTAATAALPC